MFPLPPQQGRTEIVTKPPIAAAPASLDSVFDLLDLDGEDLAALPLLERKTRLAALLEKPLDGIAFSAHETCDGEASRRPIHRLALAGGPEGGTSRPRRRCCHAA